METNLSPSFTFEKYVVGPFNESAHAVALSVAKEPGDKCNPLTICGRVGQGKTHLMTAVGHEILSRNNRARVLFICSDEFTSEMINAIRFDRIDNFRNRYRRVDVLLVDSVQYFGGKERTQAEFLQIVMSLHNRKKQIIVTSDRPFDEVSEMASGLKSFFSKGQTVKIGVPDLDTRIAILMMKAQEHSVDLPQEVVNLVAGQDDNIRIMEGCLLRLLHASSLKGVPITKALAQEALRDVFARRFRV